MSNPTISSSTLLSWPRDATLICYRHKYHRHKLNTVFTPWLAVASQGGQGHEYLFTNWRQLVRLFWFACLCVYFLLFTNAGNRGRIIISGVACIFSSEWPIGFQKEQYYMVSRGRTSLILKRGTKYYQGIKYINMSNNVRNYSQIIKK